MRWDEWLHWSWSRALGAWSRVGSRCCFSLEWRSRRWQKRETERHGKVAAERMQGKNPERARDKETPTKRSEQKGEAEIMTQRGRAEQCTPVSSLRPPVRGHGPSHPCPLWEPSTISGTGTQVPRSPGHRDPCRSACQTLESCRGANNLFRVLVTFSLGVRGQRVAAAL